MDLSQTQVEVETIISSLEEELKKIRAGRANPEMLDPVVVEVYESKMPIKHIATVSLPDARTIVIQPWDSENLEPIEKAILSSDLGITPVVDGKIVRLSVPALTKELREEYIRDMKEKVEEARLAVRGVRHKMMDAIDKKLTEGGVSEDEIKREKEDVEAVMKEYFDRVDKMSEDKEEILRTV